MCRRTARQEEANLFLPLVYNVVNDVQIRLVGQARCLAGVGIVLKALAHGLGTKVKGIAKGLMDALQGVTARHEDLGRMLDLMGIEQITGVTPSQRPWTQLEDGLRKR